MIIVDIQCTSIWNSLSCLLLLIMLFIFVSDDKLGLKPYFRTIDAQNHIVFGVWKF